MESVLLFRLTEKPAWPLINSSYQKLERYSLRHWRVVLIVSALANEMDIWQLLNSTSVHYELNRKRKCKTVNTKIQNFFIFVQNKIHVLHFCGVKENTLIA